MNTSKICFVIPTYNHHLVISKMVNHLIQFNLMIFIVNDASNTITTHKLYTLQNDFGDRLKVIHLKSNSGKGGAVLMGMSVAHSNGYTHAFQIDADGQHSLNSITRFISQSERFPSHVICGVPVFDETIPLSRLVPRYITHILVWFETLSLDIKDSMCGFRIYPINEVLKINHSINIGRRMDFDVEILVRLYWNHIYPVNLPVKVFYPENGLSNFRLFKDNLLISWMHTKLIFGMFIRLPSLIINNIRKHDKK